MIEVAMTSPDGVTLATAGKYCPEDIYVANAVQGSPAAVAITGYAAHIGYVLTAQGITTLSSAAKSIPGLKVGDTFAVAAIAAPAFGPATPGEPRSAAGVTYTTQTLVKNGAAWNAQGYYQQMYAVGRCTFFTITDPVVSITF